MKWKSKTGQKKNTNLSLTGIVNLKNFNMRNLSNLCLPIKGAVFKKLTNLFCILKNKYATLLRLTSNLPWIFYILGIRSK